MIKRLILLEILLLLICGLCFAQQPANYWLISMPASAGQQPSAYPVQLITYPSTPYGICDVYQVALNVATTLYYSCNTVASPHKWQLLGNGQTILPNTPIPFSAAPNFDGTTSSAYSMVLTGNVTNPAVTGNPINGILMKFHICQGAGGPWTFAFPANFLNTTAIQTTSCTDETYSYDGTNWSQLTQPASGGGGGGGSCSSSGAQGTLQAAATAGACQSTSLFESGGTLTVGDEFVPQGPNPYTDLRLKGARKMVFNATPAISGVTATIANGSGSATVSTQTCASQTPSTCFLQNDGVTIVGAGANHSMTTPVAPILTQVLNGVVTGIPQEQVNGPAGVTTYNAQIFEFNQFGGYTTSSPTATITTSATLGMQNVSISTEARSGETVTVTTSAPHGLPIGCVATPSTSANRCPTVYQYNAGMSDVSFAGEKAVQSVPNNTSYTYLDNVDAREGGSTSGTGGTVYWGQAVHYVMPAHTADGMFFAACSDRAVPGVFTVVGTTWPKNQTTGNYPDGTLEFNDWGATLGGATPTLPWYIPTTCPVAAAADNLTTTVSSVASNVLTLAATAGNAACAGGGCAIVIDTAPILKAAAVANPHYPIYFAPVGSTSDYYVFNSSVDFTGFNEGPSLIGGFVRINAPFILGNPSWIEGPFPANRDSPSFTFNSYPVISCNAKPCIWVANGSSGFGEFGGFQVNVGAGSQNINILQDGGGGAPGTYYHDIQSGLGSDQLGQIFICRGNPSASCAAHGSRISYFVNTPAEGATLSPLVYLDGEARFDQFDVTGRGIFARASNGTYSIGYNHVQGGVTPMFTITGQTNGGLLGANLALGWNGSIVMDTIPHAAVSNQPGLGAAAVTVNYNGNDPSIVGLFTGQRVNSPALISNQNRDTRGTVAATCNDGSFTGGSAQTINCFNDKHNVALEMARNYSFFIDGPTPTQPTCTPGGGGGVTNGTYIFSIMPVWSNGAEGSKSPFTASCVAGGGNNTLTVSWSQISPPPSSWNIYQSSGGGGATRIRNTGGTYATSCNTGQIPGNIISITLIANTNCAISPATSPSGGPVWGRNNVFTSDIYDMTSYMDVTCASPPSVPAAGFGRFYCDNTTPTSTLNCELSTGASCFFPYAINSYAVDHALSVNEKAVSATVSGKTFTAPHAQKAAWDVYNFSAGTITIAIDSGTLSGGGATGPITINANQGARVSCDGTNCYALGVPTGGGGGGCAPGGITDALQYNGGGACSFGGVNSPTVNGNYVVNYNVIAGTQVPPTINLPGVPINVQSGASYTYLYSDRGSLVTASNGGAQAYTLVNPASAGFQQNFFNVLDNIGAGAVTDNASGFTINGGASLVTPASWLRWLWSDGVNYRGEVVPTARAFPACLDAGGNHYNMDANGNFICGTSASGNGLSGMTAGQVPIAATATSVTSSKVLSGSGAGITTGPTSSTTLDVPEFTGAGGQIADTGVLFSNMVRKDAANTMGAFLTDFSASTIKIPTSAGFTAAASTMFGYDSTAKIPHIYTNNADAIAVAASSTSTTATQVLHATAVADVYAPSAIATADLPAQYTKFECSPGLGDGLNAIPAATYLQFNCVNKSGVTWTITGISCWTDNAGTSTLNAANNAATNLLTGAVTCNNTKSGGGAGGTQSGTTTLPNNDAISFTFVADGTSKQATWTVTLTQ